MESNYFFAYSALLVGGFFGGILSGLFGIGGGVVYTFILPLFLNIVYPEIPITSELIIANSLVGVLFASLGSNYKLIKSGEYYWKEAIIASFFAVIASLLANQFIVTQEWYSLKLFRGVVLVLIAIIIIRLLTKSPAEKERVIKQWEMPVIGVFGGFIAALSGFGGGVIMVPFMLILGSYGMYKARTISLGIISVNSFFLVLKAAINPPVTNEVLAAGLILPLVCLFMILGAILGGPIGVKTSKKISQQVLTNSYLSLLSVLIIYYGYKLMI